MKFGKKRYTAPSLKVHGSFEKLTQQYGSDMTDVPFGTSVSAAGPGGTTGPFAS